MENLTELNAAIALAATALSEAITNLERAGGVAVVRVIDATTFEGRQKIVTVLTGEDAVLEMRRDDLAA